MIGDIAAFAFFGVAITFVIIAVGSVGRVPRDHSITNPIGEIRSED